MIEISETESAMARSGLVVSAVKLVRDRTNMPLADCLAAVRATLPAGQDTSVYVPFGTLFFRAARRHAVLRRQQQGKVLHEWRWDEDTPCVIDVLVVVAKLLVEADAVARDKAFGGTGAVKRLVRVDVVEQDEDEMARLEKKFAARMTKRDERTSQGRVKTGRVIKKAGGL